MRILLVEDDPMIGESVSEWLQGDGYAVDWLQDGDSALLALHTTPFALVILDLGLPGRDGLEVLKEIRSKESHIPVLITTARDTVDDRIAGLDSGADDYLIKPFDLEELSARIRALLRRSAGRADPLITGSQSFSPRRSTPFWKRSLNGRGLCCHAPSWKASSTTGTPP